MTTTDNFDIYQAIIQTDKQLYPLSFNQQYFHIKGHQEKYQPFHQLSLEAQPASQAITLSQIHSSPAGLYFSKPLHTWSAYCQGFSVLAKICSLLSRLSVISLPKVSVAV